ncbi:hypothetical protein RIF29_24801 [Crotalaria pallida]|uniref:Uncharacterized protein n=1 Tax=Crotalaria pallida TaxID=3830 RepID=A0AAN9EMW1_CROPI
MCMRKLQPGRTILSLADRRRLKSMLQIDDNLAIRFLAKYFDEISVRPSYNQHRSSIAESNENLSTSTVPVNGHIRESSSSRKRRCSLDIQSVSGNNSHKNKHIRLNQERASEPGEHITRETSESQSLNFATRSRRHRAVPARQNERPVNRCRQLVVRT